VERRPGRRSLVDGELLAQGQVLEGELAVAADEEGEEPEQVEEEGDHEPRLWPGEPDRSITCRADDLLAKDRSSGCRSKRKVVRAQHPRRNSMHKAAQERCLVSILCLVTASLIGGCATRAQQYPTAEIPATESAYIAKAKTAAPEQIVKKASIVMMQGGKSRELQRGTNGYTCLIAPDGTPLCADVNGMEWMKAVGDRTQPPDKIGFIYMLAGDTGATNHQPHQRDTRMHWVQTGPHVMVVGPRVREMAGYPRTLDVADPNQPYVMFPGTPYEHLMLPTK
jgi:hypothetical protein